MGFTTPKTFLPCSDCRRLGLSRLRRSCSAFHGGHSFPERNGHVRIIAGHGHEDQAQAVRLALVVAAGGIQFALHVDRAVDLLSVQADQVNREPPLSEGALSKEETQQRGVDSRLVDIIAKTHFGIVQVIDPNKILSEPDMQAIVAIVASSTATESSM